MQELDVREMPPKDRHPAIFAILDGLEPGDFLRLVNDHDPAPLHYQMDAIRPRQFGWKYVEEGPDTWVVEITNLARVVDARPIIESGGEPFDQIMEAVSGLNDGEVLVLYAPFEPIPLEGVLGEQGFIFEANELEDGSWKVVFSR